MKLLTRSYFTLAAISVAAFLFTTGFAKPNEQYLKSATYYSDEWIVNFWNTESDHMDAELQQIAEDGFNNIILVIPWREFQKESGSYNQYALDKLDQVMNAAARHGLSVALRMGYTWDYAPGESATTRVTKLVQNEQMRNQWFAYLKKVYDKASTHDNFAGGFTTWEDFWTFTTTAAGYGKTEGSIRIAKLTGYTEYALSHYTLDELKELYRDQGLTETKIYFPSSASPARKVFFEWYDSFLMQLLTESQQYFPDLSFEVRMDGDRIYGTNGSQTYVSHYSTFGAADASYASAMWSPTMFTGGGTLTSDQALNSLKTALKTIHDAGGKKVYLEQMLFTDNTPGFEANAKIRESDKASFIKRSSTILKEYGNGYGLWTYRDYANNKLYNPQFALGEKGWSFEQGASVGVIEGSHVAILNKGASIYSGLADSNGTQNGTKTTISFTLGSVGASGRVRVILDQGESRSFAASEQKDKITYEVDGHPASIRFTSESGKIYVDNVKVYNLVTEGEVYHIDGSPASCRDAVRELNAALK